MAYSDVKNKVYGKQEKKNEESLDCSAHGCPLKWSVSNGSHLCSYHAWAEPKEWPAITEALQRSGPWKLGKTYEVDTTSHKGHMKAWALRLKERHERGDELSPLQISMYQSALKMVRDPNVIDV